ncbi:MAG: hypothetical protein EHM41_24765 [Chloroflexi bacterium]|nr:MAG: hypothetical protein EHM41_24765 [Chloroflexota bacterium]
MNLGYVFRPNRKLGLRLAQIVWVILVISSLAKLLLSVMVYYQSLHDSEQAQARFARLASCETDLEEISQQTIGVVEDKVQLEHVSLWLARPRDREWVAEKSQVIILHLAESRIHG